MSQMISSWHKIHF